MPNQSHGAARQPAVVAQAVNANALVIVPFAVPVAVPVATLQQPAVLYSYRQHAGPSVANAVTHAQPAATTDREVIAASGPSQDAASTAIFAPNTAVEIMAARCAACHTGDTPQGHLQIFDATGRILPRLPRRAILELASPDEAGQIRMPPGERTKLTAAERAALAEWARPPSDLAY